MENIKKRKKEFMDFLGVAILGILNSDPSSRQDIDRYINSIYDIIKGLKQIILQQEKTDRKNLKLLENQWKKLIEIYSIVNTYNKKKKGDLINLWNELDKLYKQEK